MNMQGFKIPVNVLVEKFPDKETYSLMSIDGGQNISEKDFETIARICNEELIYKVLFAEKFEDKPYTLEVGYWMSNGNPGVMTNAVRAICDIAKTAGYKSLYGLTVLNNEKSQKVLINAEFENVGEIKVKGKQYLKFIKII